MKRLHQTRILAFLLALVTVGLLLPFGTLALTLTSGETTEAQYLESLAEDDITVGGTLYAPDLSKGVPANWDSSNDECTFLWNAKAGSQSITAEDGGIHYKTSGKADTILFPAIGAENYVYSAKFTAKGLNGSFGLAVECQSGTSIKLFYVYPTDRDEMGLQHYGVGGPKYYKGIRPAIELDTTVTLTTYHLNGESHFFVDGVYVATLADSELTPGKIGLYNCGGDALVTDISVKALQDGDTPTPKPPFTFTSGETTESQYLESLAEDKKLIAGEILYAPTLSENVPADWDTSNDECTYLWNAKAGSQTITAEDGGIHYKTSGKADIILFPALRAENYVYSAKFTAKGLKGSFGLAVECQSGSGKTFFVYPSDSEEMGIQYAGVSGQKYYPNIRKTIEVGTTVTMTAYHLNGESHFFIDGVYVASLSDKEATAGKIGLYNCGGDALVTDITVKALEEIDTTYTPKFTNVREEVSLGKMLYGISFSETADNVLPSGWDKDYKKYDNFRWKSGNEKLYAAATKDGAFRFSSGNGDFYITLPQPATENYVFTAEVSMVETKGSFGLVTDLSKGGAVENKMYGADGTVCARRHGADNPDGTDKGFQFASGETFRMTVYHYNDTSYFYINEIFITATADMGSEPGTIGFYSCNGNVAFENVEVHALAGIRPNSQVPNYLLTDSLYDSNFNALADGGIPEGWNCAPNITFGWNYGNAETKYDLAKMENGEFRYKVGGLDSYTMLPDVKTDSYAISVTLRFLSTNGTFGIMTDFHDKTMGTDTGYAQQFCISKNGSTYMRSQTPGGNSVDTDPITLAEGAYFTMTIYHCKDIADGKDYAYYFVNGICLGKMADYGETDGRIGLFLCSGEVAISSVNIYKMEFETDPAILGKGALSMLGAQLRYADDNGVANGWKSSGIRFGASFDKTSMLYAFYHGAGEYVYSKDAKLKFGMLLIPTDRLGSDAELTTETADALNVVATKIKEQTDGSLSYIVTLREIPTAALSRSYTARAYVELTTEKGVSYLYSDPIKRTPVQVANTCYKKQAKNVQQALDVIFQGAEGYTGKNTKSVTFTLFSDLHYKKGMYVANVSDMNTILDRANAAGSDFILHAGDFCNDFIGSKELTDAYLKNKYNLPAYGVYGNHELEASGNSMGRVTPMMTNRADDVVWGTADGKIGDGSIGYYYYEVNGIRIVCTDTNYSLYNGEWVHNTTNSYGPPSGATNINALGPTQLAWLERVLTEAANAGTKCIVVSHADFSGKLVGDGPSADAAAVREIYKKVNAISKGTVLLSINGHNHTDRIGLYDDVVYMDCNTVFNGWWAIVTGQHYTAGQTFAFENYDSNGKFIGISDRNLSSLSQATNTWFFEDPLSCTITVTDGGVVSIEGMTTTWRYDVIPETAHEGVHPWISSAYYELWN